MEVLVIGRIERRTGNVCRDARGNRKPLAIRSGDIKGHHRNEKKNMEIKGEAWPMAVPIKL
jgi:hypothetical protein